LVAGPQLIDHELNEKRDHNREQDDAPRRPSKCFDQAWSPKALPLEGQGSSPGRQEEPSGDATHKPGYQYDYDGIAKRHGRDTFS
jgi:hypothetical protein